MRTLKSNNITLKIISAVLVCLFTLNTCCYGLATLPASQNPLTKREALADLRRTQVRYAESKDAKRLLKENNTDALLLPNGKYLVSREVADNDLRLLQAIIHEDVEALMQILSRDNRYKYNGIKDLILRHFPPTRDNLISHYPRDNYDDFSIELYVNHIVAKGFEWISPMHDGVILKSEIPEEEKKFVKTFGEIVEARKHDYFTGEFWDHYERGERIRIATSRGMRFNQASIGLGLSQSLSQSQTLTLSQTLAYGFPEAAETGMSDLDVFLYDYPEFAPYEDVLTRIAHLSGPHVRVVLHHVILGLKDILAEVEISEEDGEKVIEIDEEDLQYSKKDLLKYAIPLIRTVWDIGDDAERAMPDIVRSVKVRGWGHSDHFSRNVQLAKLLWANGIYPRRTLIELLQESDDAVSLINKWKTLANDIQENRVPFDREDSLHRRLVYSQYKKIAYHALKRGDEGFNYKTFRKFLKSSSVDADKDSDEDHISEGMKAELMYASFESFKLLQFIKATQKKAAELGRKVVVVPNLSYGRFAIEPITEELRKLGIEIEYARVGSTEAHSNPGLIKPNLFSDKFISKTLIEQPIIIVVDGTTHIVDRTKEGKSARYPDAHVGYLNFISTVNDVICSGKEEEYTKTVNRSKSFMEWLKKDPFFKALKSKVLKIALKINGHKVSPYEMAYWNPEGNKLVLRQYREELGEAGAMNPEDLRGPTLIIANSTMTDGGIPTALKNMAMDIFHTPAFFDDNSVIQDVLFRLKGGRIELSDTIEKHYRETYEQVAAAAEKDPQAYSVPAREINSTEESEEVDDTPAPVARRISQRWVKEELARATQQMPSLKHTFGNIPKIDSLSEWPDFYFENFASHMRFSAEAKAMTRLPEAEDFISVDTLLVEFGEFFLRARFARKLASLMNPPSDDQNAETTEILETVWQEARREGYLLSGDVAKISKKDVPPEFLKKHGYSFSIYNASGECRSFMVTDFGNGIPIDIRFYIALEEFMTQEAGIRTMGMLHGMIEAARGNKLDQYIGWVEENFPERLKSLVPFLWDFSSVSQIKDLVEDREYYLSSEERLADLFDPDDLEFDSWYLEFHYPEENVTNKIAEICSKYALDEIIRIYESGESLEVWNVKEKEPFLHKQVSFLFGDWNNAVVAALSNMEMPLNKLKKELLPETCVEEIEEEITIREAWRACEHIEGEIENSNIDDKNQTVPSAKDVLMIIIKTFGFSNFSKNDLHMLRDDIPLFGDKELEELIKLGLVHRIKGNGYAANKALINDGYVPEEDPLMETFRALYGNFGFKPFEAHLLYPLRNHYIPAKIDADLLTLQRLGILFQAKNGKYRLNPALQYSKKKQSEANIATVYNIGFGDWQYAEFNEGDKLVVSEESVPFLRERIRLELLHKQFERTLGTRINDTYNIKIWSGYVLSDAQRALMQDIRDAYSEKGYNIDFGNISDSELSVKKLVDFALSPEGQKDNAVTILPYEHEYVQKNLDMLKKSNVIFMDYEGWTNTPHGFCQLGGIIASGVAYINNDEYVFMKIYDTLTGALKPQWNILKNVKIDPSSFRFIILPEMVKEAEQLRILNDRLRTILMAA